MSGAIPAASSPALAPSGTGLRSKLFEFVWCKAHVWEHICRNRKRDSHWRNSLAPACRFVFQAGRDASEFVVHAEIRRLFRLGETRAAYVAISVRFPRRKQLIGRLAQQFRPLFLRLDRTALTGTSSKMIQTAAK